MSQAEYLSWRKFYADQPFDDRHRYHRPAALIAASMGGKLQDKLDWLSPPQMTGADLATIRAFGFTGKPSR
jgi:hypothetical protein